MHQQEQRTAKMRRLLQKDLLIKAAANCYTFGRFTYPQVTACVMHAQPLHNVYCSLAFAVACMSCGCGWALHVPPGDTMHMCKRMKE
jgi:hypothetical protein